MGLCSPTFNPDQDIPDLSGQVIIVTGGNAGLGFETVRQLAKHNPSRVYLAARSKEKAEAAIKQLKDADPDCAPITFLHLDLSSFQSIIAAAQTFKASESRLDILVNNAGIMMTAEGLTKDGYEIQFGTNVMGPALFTQLLLPVLKRTAKINPQARVVNLSSGSEAVAPGDIYKFDELKTTMPNRHTTARYALSKIADIHYTTAMAEKHKDVRFISVHPGMVATNLHHDSTGTFLKPFLYAAILFATPVEKGAYSQLWAAVSPDAQSGEFYGPVGVAGKGSKLSQDRVLGEQLWDWIQGELRDVLQVHGN
ncbi:putative oxidoreductase [Lasiodiplodia hormozganensis]|uniref:Oxidoreductase n=1 Tax=Lasiodiplodia hormozganensis TaxID=869390 RepID=A0AA39XUU4_9PEZI|nr:putative oxidoreductase [Lasiodiplodia hormozganensis]